MPLKVLPSKLCTPCAPRVFLTQKGGYQQCCHAGTPFRKKTSKFGFERSDARQIKNKIAHAGRQCKCASDSPGGRAGTAPLISRLRHRQFGTLLTASVVGKQTDEEIHQERHPVVILYGRDLAVILMEQGLNSAERVWAWLEGEIPNDSPAATGWK
jgi:hypothetical protein